MLFDLRSKGRRRTVQGVYLVLALILGGGLVLFGVGNGNGVGGLLNAFNGSGNGGAASAFVSKQEKAAVRQTKLHPQDPAAWAALAKARYSAASQGSNFDTTKSTYTPAGKKVLAQVTQAWERYLTLAKKPDADLAVLAARAYDTNGDFKKEAATWQIVTAANPNVSTYYQYLALAAWQAKNSNLGDLAEQKAVSLEPKSQRSLLKQQLDRERSAILGPSATPTTPTTSTTATTPTTPGSTTTTPASGSSKKGSGGARSSSTKSSGKAKSKTHK